ncbi:hypothetical protein FACS1894105_03820 [Clostridia bacterium]|nr:hypothetical protein FACS1894105_03820 [Clostridia bacterium]
MSDNFNSKIADNILKIVLTDYHNDKIKESRGLISNKFDFSDEYLERKRKILAVGRRSEKKIQSRKNSNALRYFNTVAVAVLVVVSVTFVSLLSVEAVRNEIAKVVMTFYKENINVFISNDDIDVPTTITEIFLPSYIAEGFVKVEENKFRSNVRVIYSNADVDAQLIFNQHLLNLDVNFDGEDYTLSKVEINGKEGFLYEYTKPGGIFAINLLWQDGRYSYTITAYGVSTDEVLKTASSLMKEE